MKILIAVLSFLMVSNAAFASNSSSDRPGINNDSVAKEIQGKIQNRSGIVGAVVAAAKAERSLNCDVLTSEDVFVRPDDGEGQFPFRAVVSCHTSGMPNYMITFDGTASQPHEDGMSIWISNISFGQAD